MNIYSLFGNYKLGTLHTTFSLIQTRENQINITQHINLLSKNFGLKK